MSNVAAGRLHGVSENAVRRALIKLRDHPELAGDGVTPWEPNWRHGSDTNAAEETVLGGWQADGSGTFTWANVSDIPTADDIRAIIALTGENPDDYRWRVTNIKWNVSRSDNDSAWQRDQANIGVNHSAYTGPAHVERRTGNVAIRIERITDKNRPFLLEFPPAFNIILNGPKRETGTVSKDWHTGVSFPDLQAWYFRSKDGVWHANHDEAAVDVSHQIVAYVDDQDTVDEVIDHGDMNDQPIFSKHRSSLAHLDNDAFNKTNRRLAEILATRTALTPNALWRKIIRGNHDDRLLLKLIDEFPALVGVEDPLTGELLLSLDRLYGASAAGWSLTDPYPEGHVWLTPNFIAVHGPFADGKPGGTGAKHLQKEMNVLFGHSPHAQMVFRTVTKGAETRTYVAATGGGLMRVDGVVPSASGRYDERGAPLGVAANPWEQGFIIYHHDVEGSWTPRLELVQICNGSAMFRGEWFHATRDVDGNLLEDAA